MTKTQAIRTYIFTLTITALGVITSVAHADDGASIRKEVPRIDNSMPAIDGGLELALAINSAHSTGDIGGGMTGSDLIGSGTELDLQVGSRITPYVALGFYTTGQAFTSGSNVDRDVYTGTAGVEADFHAKPYSKVDPWVSVGTGLRAVLTDENAGVGLIVGAELVRLQLGVDFRVSEDFAVGPVIGASASLHGAQRDAMTEEFAELGDKGIHWVFSVGFGGRFNAFGSRR